MGSQIPRAVYDPWPVRWTIAVLDQLGLERVVDLDRSDPFAIGYQHPPDLIDLEVLELIEAERLDETRPARKKLSGHRALESDENKYPTINSKSQWSSTLKETFPASGEDYGAGYFETGPKPSPPPPPVRDKAEAAYALTAETRMTIEQIRGLRTNGPPSKAQLPFRERLDNALADLLHLFSAVVLADAIGVHRKNIYQRAKACRPPGWRPSFNGRERCGPLTQRWTAPEPREQPVRSQWEDRALDKRLARFGKYPGRQRIFSDYAPSNKPAWLGKHGSTPEEIEHGRAFDDPEEISVTNEGIQGAEP